MLASSHCAAMSQSKTTNCVGVQLTGAADPLTPAWNNTNSSDGADVFFTGKESPILFREEKACYRGSLEDLCHLPRS